MPVVHLIRHGQASFGSSDYDVLSPTGHQQADLVAAELRRRGITPQVIAAGSLKRQLDTASAMLADGVTVADGVLVDQRWNEYDHMAMLRQRRAATLWAMAGGGGRDRSRSVQKVLDAALLDWASGTGPNPAGQTWAQFSAGAIAALDSVLAQAGSGGTALVFTSGGVIAAVCARLLGLGAEGYVSLNRVVVNTGITTITSGRSGTSLLTFNDHSHLAGQQALLTYR
jgi:broad specificity phosphatase PhoE